MARVRCPRLFCSSKDIQALDKRKENFSVGKGVLGALLFNHEVGLLFGVEDAVHTYKCLKCGKKWRE